MRINLKPPPAGKDGFPDDLPDCPEASPLDPLADLGPQGLAAVKQALPAQFNWGRIDYGLQINAMAVAQPTPFRFMQVEQLLGQAATLLERALAARSDWQALGEKSFSTWLEIREFLDLETIHADEVAHGFYALATSDAWASSGADGAVASGAKQALAILLAAISPNAPNTATALQRAPNVNAQTSPQTVDSWTQAFSLDGQQKAAEARKSGSDWRADFENCNVDFRRRRTESARQNSLMKAVAYTQKGSAYNFEERRGEIKKRFDQDFKDAIERLKVLNDGFATIYDYRMTFSNSNMPLNDTIVMVRDAMEWLVRFSAQEQNYILPLSLATLTGAQWQPGLMERGGAWDFTVPATLFPGQRHVRLRGVSAAVMTNDRRTRFQAVVRAPRRGAITYLSGATVELDQQAPNVPLVRLARIEAVDSPRPPDVVGTQSLHNVSPISAADPALGAWRIVITGKQQPPQITDTPPAAANPNWPVNPIEDVILYLHLAVRGD